MRRRLILACPSLVFILAVGACASAGGPSAAQVSQDQITTAEISASPAQSVFELVRRLRPAWLRSGPAEGQVTLVYLDGRRLGGLGVLQTLTASGIRSLQWLDGVRAATILPDIAGESIHGAILISTSTKP